MGRKSGKVPPFEGGENGAGKLEPYPIRLRRGTIAAFERRAGELGAKTTALMRGVLEGSLEELPMPAVVPEVNLEVWMEMRVATQDLHRAVRALDSSRSPALDAAVKRAAVSTGSLVDWLRTDSANPDQIAAAADVALDDARALNAAIHSLLNVRTEELVPGAVLAVMQAAEALWTVSIRVLGGLIRETPW